MKKMTVLFLTLLIIVSGCKKKEEFKSLDVLLETGGNLQETKKYTKEFDLYGVVTVNRLRFRTANDIHAKTIRYLDQGDIVNIISKSDERVRINDVEDYWYQAEFQEARGWLFGYYLETYNTYQNAKNASKKYSGEVAVDESDTVNYDFINNYINKNLIFISDGKILEITDSTRKKATILNTIKDGVILSYTISPDSNYIYYLVQIDQNTSVYKYDYTNQINELIVKKSSQFCIDFVSGKLISVEQSKFDRENSWVFKSIDIENGNEHIFSNIPISPFTSSSGSSSFIKALTRERGGAIHLEYDNLMGVVRFKSPDEDQGYLITMVDGSFIRIQILKSTEYRLDSNRVIIVENVMNTDGTVSYSLIMRDSMTGYHKEILKTGLYPMNFVMSKMNDLIAVSMADTKDETMPICPTSIYLISLVNNELLPISTDGKSYQPGWRR